jgi:hypothetical protein
MQRMVSSISCFVCCRMLFECRMFAVCYLSVACLSYVVWVSLGCRMLYECRMVAVCCMNVAWLPYAARVSHGCHSYSCHMPVSQILHVARLSHAYRMSGLRWSCQTKLFGGNLLYVCLCFNCRTPTGTLTGTPTSTPTETWCVTLHGYFERLLWCNSRNVL